MVSNGTTATDGLVSGRRLLGWRVETPLGKGLGRIEDVMVGPEPGGPAYAVVSFGKIASLTAKRFAFPWSALRVDGPRKTVVLTLDRKTLARSRRFVGEPETEPAAPVLGPTSATASSSADPDRMDHWGETWEHHGLDRP